MLILGGNVQLANTEVAIKHAHFNIFLKIVDLCVTVTIKWSKNTNCLIV